MGHQASVIQCECRIGPAERFQLHKHSLIRTHPKYTRSTVGRCKKRIDGSWLGPRRGWVACCTAGDSCFLNLEASPPRCPTGHGALATHTVSVTPSSSSAPAPPSPRPAPPQDSESAFLVDLAALVHRLQDALPPGPVLQCYPDPDGLVSGLRSGPGEQRAMRRLDQLFAQAACADLFLRDKVANRPSA